MTTIHNAIKRGGQLLTSIGNLVGLGEGEEGTFRLGETLTPILNVWELPEAALGRGETLICGRALVAAVAAENSFVGLRNPSGSGVLCRLDGAVYGSSVASAIRVNATYGVVVATDIDSLSAPFKMDSRHPGWTVAGTNLPTLITGAGAGLVGSLGTFVAQWCPTNDSREFPRYLKVVLGPGVEVRFYNATVNQEIDVSIYARYRNFMPSEPRFDR